MNYCRRCLYPENHPLNIVLDDEGICTGCRIHEEKDRLDWRSRFADLKKLTDGYRSQSGRNYDCVVPVSGTRDSWYMVHVVKNVLGLKPLLAYYNAQYNTALGTRNLAYMRQAFDCDLTGLNASTKMIRDVTRASVKSLGSMYWHVLAGQTVWPVRVAMQYRVPLIIWGAHQGVDQVGMYSHLQEVEMTRKYRKEHDLMGMEIQDLVAAHPELEAVNTAPFNYPHDEELEAVGVRGIYLSNYLRWDSKKQHELMIREYGYETRRQARTFDTYSDPDSHHYSGLHDLIKYRKFGYSRVTDHASREIRLRRMSRQQGMDLVRQYHSDEIPPDTALFCDWLGMGQDELFGHVDRFRDPTVWEKQGKNWKLKHSVLDTSCDADAALPPLEQWQDYTETENRRPDFTDDQYVVIGKGYVDGYGPERPVVSREMPETAFGRHIPDLFSMEDF